MKQNTVPFLAFNLGGGQKYSHAGTRTRVYWVKANYPNHLDYMGWVGYHTDLLQHERP